LKKLYSNKFINYGPKIVCTSTFRLPLEQAMNREEGSYQLSHAYDRFLGTGLTYCAKNRKKKWLFSFSWWRLLVEVETLRYKQFLVVI